MIPITKEICKELFSNFNILTDERKEELDCLAKQVIKDNDWNNVYYFFDSYLRK